MESKNHGGWDRNQARLFVRRVMDRWGIGWKLLSADTKRAYLNSEALSVVMGNHSPVNPDAVCDLFRAMHEIANVTE